MSYRLADIVRCLEDFAAYTGPWRPLRNETDLLTRRVAELKQRESRLDDVLIVTLVGGSGVGKSTLLNALAGDMLAKSSEYRPCTSVPTVYRPPGAEVQFEGWNQVSGSALENLILIDTPDSDTIVKEHREIVIEALKRCDLILVCGSGEKYLDEATWSLLRPLQGERTMVCVETKASLGETVKDHWVGRMEEHGFSITDYFRVDGRRTLDRKLSGNAPGENEYDFARLEHFLAQELDREQVRRIKRSNATGLLTKTVATLDERVVARGDELIALEGALDEAGKAVLLETFNMVRERLFGEPHLWNYALGREVSIRAKGLVGFTIRAVEGVRSLPARMASWVPLSGRKGAGQHAAAMLADQDVFTENVDLASSQAAALYNAKRGELALGYAKADFDPIDPGEGFSAFAATVEEKISLVLRGPARDRLVRRARWLTSWPVAILSDAPIAAFVVFSCYMIVRDYVMMVLPPVFFLHSISVFLIILAAELIAFSTVSRMLAWTARRGAIGDLRASFMGIGDTFAPEREALEDVKKCIEDIASLKEAIKE